MNSPIFEDALVGSKFNVSGFKRNESDGKGIQNWNITISNCSMQRSTLTGNNGSYKFTNISKGTYTVIEEMKPDWTNMTPPSKEIYLIYEDVSNVNFTNRPIVRTFNVSGYKINNSDSTGLSGWKITIDNGTRFDTFTNGTGYYEFKNLINGSYTIYEEQRSGWQNITAAIQDITILGQDKQNINFSNQAIIPTFNLSGYKINSIENTGIQNWNITISNFTMHKSTLTDDSGYYNFTNLINGTYYVTEEDRPGWMNITIQPTR